MIGKNDVAVPTHLYKVILADNDNDQESPCLAAFIIPNIPISYEHKLEEYQVPLEQLEARVGMTFVPKLNRSKTQNLCEVEGCKVMDKNQFDLFIIGRKLAYAQTKNKLDKAWKEIEKKNLHPDKYTTDLYNRKKLELQKKEAENREE